MTGERKLDAHFMCNVSSKILRIRKLAIVDKWFCLVKYGTVNLSYQQKFPVASLPRSLLN